jgi:hypothetical protein
VRTINKAGLNEKHYQQLTNDNENQSGEMRGVDRNLTKAVSFVEKYPASRIFSYGQLGQHFLGF